jgi:hypothetical protein
LKTKLIVSKLVGLTLVGVCILHFLELDLVKEYVAGNMTCEPARTEDLCHWTTVLPPLRYVSERLAGRELLNNSFLFPYCMVPIIAVLPLHCFQNLIVTVLDAMFFCRNNNICSTPQTYTHTDVF